MANVWVENPVGIANNQCCQRMDESKVYAREDEDIVIEKKMAPVAQ